MNSSLPPALVLVDEQRQVGEPRARGHEDRGRGSAGADGVVRPRTAARGRRLDGRLEGDDAEGLALGEDHDADDALPDVHGPQLELEWQALARGRDLEAATRIADDLEAAARLDEDVDGRRRLRRRCRGRRPGWSAPGSYDRHDQPLDGVGRDRARELGLDGSLLARPVSPGSAPGGRLRPRSEPAASRAGHRGGRVGAGLVEGSTVGSGCQPRIGGSGSGPPFAATGSVVHRRCGSSRVDEPDRPPGAEDDGARLGGRRIGVGVERLRGRPFVESEGVDDRRVGCATEQRDDLLDGKEVPGGPVVDGPLDEDPRGAPGSIPAACLGGRAVGPDDDE